MRVNKMKKSNILNTNGMHFELPENDINHSARRTMTDVDIVSVSQVLGSMEMPARTRTEIYQSYSYMQGDPIIGQALNLHVTQSLGGHETTGDVIFVEAKSNASDAERKLIDEINHDLSELLNKNAYQMAFIACTYGDGFSRLYGEAKKGICYIECSDFFLPQFVLPFEQFGDTVGYRVNVDENKQATLSVTQLARLKMPRMGFLPQHRMQYNYLIQAIEQDDLAKHLPLAANVGGSFLMMAEKPFFLLQSALLGLTSGRILDSMREQFYGLNMKDMTKEQQDAFFNAFSGMLKQSKQRAKTAVQNKTPIIEKMMHLLPVWDEKQVYQIDAGGASLSNTNAYSVDDVLFYAKMLAGGLGLDLSMLGFSDLLSGGLGDGGFFRVSAQSGQRARLLRQGLTGWVNHIIDVHCYFKYGGSFNKNRPYEVVFNGATSALERENQETRERKNAAASVALQNFSSLRELGLDEATMMQFIKDQMGFDEDEAQMYAKNLSGSPNNENDEEME